MDLQNPTAAIIVGSVALLAVLAITVLVIRGYMKRQARKKAEQAEHDAMHTELSTLLNRIMAGDLTAYDEIEKCNRGDRRNTWARRLAYCTHNELLTRYHSALTYAALLTNRRDTTAKATSALAAFRTAESNEARLDALDMFFKAMRNAHKDNVGVIYGTLEVSEAEMLSTLNETIQARYDELLAAARDGNAQALLQLDTLITDTRETDRSHHYCRPFHMVPVTELRRPEGWNGMVAKLIRNPGLDLFETEDKVTASDVLHMAAEADRTGRLVDMLLVLAYRNAWPSVMAILPDGLVSSLARQVDAQRAEAKTHQF